MSKRKPESKEQKVSYDPKANYVWKAEDMFNISGIEIEKINRALQAAASGPEFQKAITIFEGLAAFQNFFKEAVEEGLIVQQEEGKENGKKEESALTVVETE